MALWPLYCLFFFDLQILITPLVSYRFSLPLWYLTNSHYPFGILQILITPLVSYRFSLPLWYLTDSHYPFGIFKLFVLKLVYFLTMSVIAETHWIWYLLCYCYHYLWWWTITPRGYHPPNSQYFDTAVVYLIYLWLKFTVPK